tara:strand:- start:910 stop:1164 length:255 start_codon:yes stop_codon:yes gene_type:complete
MNNYIEATCIGSPLGLPEYNEDTEQWELFFEENYDEWNPYFERDILSVSFESAEEVTDAYNHYNQNPVMEEKEDEVNQEDTALV